MNSKAIKFAWIYALMICGLSACGITPATQPTENNNAIDTVATYAAQTLEAMALPSQTLPPAPTAITITPAVIPPTSTSLAETATSINLPSLLPTNSLSATPKPTTASVPLACEPNGMELSHIQINNNAGQAVTVYIYSDICFKEVTVADTGSAIVEVPVAKYVVYGYIGEAIYFRVSYYVSDPIHTWVVNIYPDHAEMLGP